MAIGNKGGRPRKPRNLKLIQGTLQPCRDNIDEPQYPDASLEPPPGFAGEELRQWQHLVPLLLQVRVLTEADRNALARYCTMQAQWGGLKRQLKEQPELIETMMKLNVQLKGLEVEFGLTPSSRSRIHAKPVAQEDENAKKERRCFGN
jgi:phage terminase small subunit